MGAPHAPRCPGRRAGLIVAGLVARAGALPADHHVPIALVTQSAWAAMAGTLGPAATLES